MNAKKDAVLIEMKMAGKVVSEARETKQNKKQTNKQINETKCQTTCLEFLKMYFTFRPELVMEFHY